jgi:LETM1 and EF-hand domain-containing protein 1
MKPEEAVVATLSSLPDEVVDTVGTVLPSEDSVSERKRKLEFLEMQEELIKVLQCIINCENLSSV